MLPGIAYKAKFFSGRYPGGDFPVQSRQGMIRVAQNKDVAAGQGHHLIRVGQHGGHFAAINNAPNVKIDQGAKVSKLGSKWIP
jgi:hypothetical protein